MIQHAQIQKVLKKVQFQSVRLLESVKSVCIISENEFDMIGSFVQKIRSSQIREIISFRKIKAVKPIMHLLPK